MCFDINPKSKKERTLWQATEDIVCYKILEKRIDGSLYGYIYLNYRYIPNKILKSKLLIPENGNYLTRKDSTYYEIEEGLHSFKKLNDLKIWANIPRPRGPERAGSGWFFYKFIIPKGAYFYENKTQYVSNKIKLVEEIKL